MKRIMCPLCFIQVSSEEEIIKHFKEEHPGLNELKIGTKKIRIDEEN